MKMRMLKLYAGVCGVYDKGRIVDIPEELAKAFASAGAAEYIDRPEVKKNAVSGDKNGKRGRSGSRSGVGKSKS